MHEEPSQGKRKRRMQSALEGRRRIDPGSRRERDEEQQKIERNVPDIAMFLHSSRIQQVSESGSHPKRPKPAE